MEQESCFSPAHLTFGNLSLTLGCYFWLSLPRRQYFFEDLYPIPHQQLIYISQDFQTHIINVHVFHVLTMRFRGSLKTWNWHPRSGVPHFDIYTYILYIFYLTKSYIITKWYNHCQWSSHDVIQGIIENSKNWHPSFGVLHFD